MNTTVENATTFVLECGGESLPPGHTGKSPDGKVHGLPNGTKFEMRIGVAVSDGYEGWQQPYYIKISPPKEDAPGQST